MRKFFSVIILMALVMTFCTCASAELKVIIAESGYLLAFDDRAGLLNQEEADRVHEAMLPVTEYASVGFITVDSHKGNTSSATLARQWGEERFGGAENRFTVFIIDMAAHHLDIYASKPLSDILTSEILQSIMDNTYLYASGGKFGLCATEVFAQISKAMEHVPGEFVFRGKIKWGMSMEEVLSLEDGDSDSYTSEPFIALAFDAVPVSKYNGMLNYYFRNDRLLFCDYYIKDKSASYEYLQKVVSVVYGEGLDASMQDIVELYSKAGGRSADQIEEQIAGEKATIWRAAGDTLIYLIATDNYISIIYASPEFMNYEEEVITTGI